MARPARSAKSVLCPARLDLGASFGDFLQSIFAARAQLVGIDMPSRNVPLSAASVFGHEVRRRSALQLRLAILPACS